MRRTKELSKKKSKCLDGTILRRESRDMVERGEDLQKYGTKFEEEKANLEKEIEKIENSRLSAEDKREMLNKVKQALELLQEQYDTEVAEEQEKVQIELTEQTEAMQEASDEAERHASDLRNVKMEVGKTDASAAADAADEKKREFDQMKAEYLQKQKLLMEQAAIQRRNMQKRRLTGR